MHHLGPIEIYKGRPIFYGLGNFIWSDIQEPLAADLYERHRDLLAAAFGDPSKATDADLTALLNATGFNDTSFGSEHPGGANFLLCDGSVRFITNGIDFRTYQSAATRDGGEVVNLD